MHQDSANSKKYIKKLVSIIPSSVSDSVGHATSDVAPDSSSSREMSSKFSSISLISIDLIVFVSVNVLQ